MAPYITVTLKLKSSQKHLLNTTQNPKKTPQKGHFFESQGKAWEQKEIELSLRVEKLLREKQDWLKPVSG